MATTVAHGLIGIAMYCAIRPVGSPVGSREIKLPLSLGMLFMAAVVANIPDLDMIVSLLVYGDHRVLHGGVSHTVFFAAGGGFFVWLFARQVRYRAELAITVAFILLSHVLVDFFTGPSIGLHPTHGAVPFWPVTEIRMISPVTIFKGVEHRNILPGALYTALWELVLLFPLTAFIVYRSCKSDSICRKDWLSNR